MSGKFSKQATKHHKGAVRGVVEDWLDEQDYQSRGYERRGTKKKKTKHKNLPNKVEPLAQEDANATVSEVFPKLSRVKMDSAQELLCSYRRASFFYNNARNGMGDSEEGEGFRERSPVAVGDRVKVTVLGSRDGIIEAACGRKNIFFRHAPGKEDKQQVHVLGANLDVLVIVSSAEQPSFSPGLVDRFLIAAQKGGCPVYLCVNKVDLLNGGDPLSPDQPWANYGEQLGIPLFFVSAKCGSGIDKLSQAIAGKTALFCGHSGVGKTSLLRALLQKTVGKVAEVNQSTQKGRHTTTGAVLLQGPDDSKWIDTPGVREFGLVGILPEELAEYFPEFKSLACAQEGCLHVDEPECDAISLPRHSSYCRILESLIEGGH